MTFLDVFDHQESRKDVSLTTFSETQNGLDLGILFLPLVKRTATHIYP